MPQRQTQNILLSAALLLCCSSCDLFRKEAERTKGQLIDLSDKSGLTEATKGMGDATKGLGKGYDDHVAPVVNPIGTMTSDAMNSAVQTSENVAAIKAATDEAGRSMSVAGEKIERYSNKVASKLPHSERELNQTVNNWNNEFTEWLRKQNPNVGNSGGRKKK